MAFSRLTMTPSFAMTCEPWDSVRLMMAGSSSGEMPTARATENSNESMGGFRSSTLIANTMRTSTSMICVRNPPNIRMPRSNSVSGGRRVSFLAISPKAVEDPVFVRRTVALPLWTLVPMYTQLARSFRAVSSPRLPGCFEMGRDSPVRIA
ncbi:hypothetical protein SDC9_181450 [bioreactor metagenome]|uniref:Uncharacterized protein n=1 Tax=bioreactor metagenome TaxID=1076179 RepID=A0A645H4L4_9ZZZZ